jgi:hypothetical protein
MKMRIARSETLCACIAQEVTRAGLPLELKEIEKYVADREKLIDQRLQKILMPFHSACDGTALELLSVSNRLQRGFQWQIVT